MNQALQNSQIPITMYIHCIREIDLDLADEVNSTDLLDEFDYSDGMLNKFKVSLTH